MFGSFVITVLAGLTTASLIRAARCPVGSRGRISPKVVAGAGVVYAILVVFAWCPPLRAWTYGIVERTVASSTR